MQETIESLVVADTAWRLPDRSKVQANAGVSAPSQNSEDFCLCARACACASAGRRSALDFLTCQTKICFNYTSVLNYFMLQGMNETLKYTLKNFHRFIVGLIKYLLKTFNCQSNMIYFKFDK